MKRLFRSGLSIFCCTALLLTMVLFTPFKASAATAAQLHLRIEGSAAEIYSGEVDFTEGESVYDILEAFTQSHHLSFASTTSSYGKYVTAIGGDIQSDDYSRYWSFFINDASPDLGVSSVKPHDGDDVVMAFVDYSLNYPLISGGDDTPAPGESFTYHLSTDIAQYDANFNPVGITNTPISYADVLFNGSVYETDASGNLTLTMPLTEGSYSLSFDNKVTTSPRIIKTGSIAINVSNTTTAAREIGVKSADRVVDLSASAVSSINILGGEAAISLATTGSSDKSGSLSSPLTVSVRDSYHLFTVNFPSATISGPPSWDGKITFSYPDHSALALGGGTLDMAVGVGSSCDLTLTGYAKITLPGQSGKSAGYFDASGAFHPITVRLLSDTVAEDFSESDAYYDNGTDLIIYAKHFSSFVSYTPQASNSDSSLESALSSSASYLESSGQSDWSVLALKLAGKTVPSGYLTEAAQTLDQNQGTFTNPVTLAKTILLLRAAGADPQNFNSLNLVEKLFNYQNITKTGLNGPVFALLALDSGNYTTPADTLWNRTTLIDQILNYQNGGGFSLDHELATDPDITAMTLTALSPYLNETAVLDAVNAGLTYLSSKQTDDGGFIANGNTQESCESAAQVVITLSSLNIDPDKDSRFIKNRISVMDNLMSYFDSDGAFAHTAGAETDITATQQAVLALEAYDRYLGGSATIYDLSSISPTITSAQVPEVTVSNPDTGSKNPNLILLASVLMLGALIIPLSRKMLRFH